MKCAVCLGEFEECDMIRKTVKKQPQSKHVQCRTLQRPPPQAPIIAINDATLCLEGNQEVIDKCPCPCLLDDDALIDNLVVSAKQEGTKDDNSDGTQGGGRCGVGHMDTRQCLTPQCPPPQVPVAAISDTCLCLKSDQEVINKCPDFVYSTVKENVAVECAVCLSEFEECDMMRHLSVPSFLVISAKEEGLTDDNSDGHPRRRMLGSWTLNRWHLEQLQIMPFAL
ncbi:hypothetical protein JHK85_015416 [Glycine max]|nr:hypothetical protein JHK85_015416 [Glycine max]